MFDFAYVKPECVLIAEERTQWFSWIISQMHKVQGRVTQSYQPVIINIQMHMDRPLVQFSAPNLPHHL